MSYLKSLISLSLIILLSFPCLSQIKSIRKNKIKTQLLKRINELRLEQGVGVLELDQKLEKPAEVHSVYMSKRNTLTHGHSIFKFDTPEKRIEYFSPTQFDAFGENILLSKKVEMPLNEKRAIQLANEMFEAWEDSPGHYANMIDREFDSCNFGFELSANRQVYATNVFGRKGIKIENQISDNSFGLIPNTVSTCFDATDFYSNVLVNIGNAVRIEGKQVMLYYHNKALFLDVFSGVKDGIAVDVISKEQMECQSRNRLDISPIYDGVLLEPVYRKEIIENNIAKSDYRLISMVGTIPESLIGKEISLVILLIKSGVVCKQIFQTEVSRAAYPLKPLQPKLENPENVLLSNTTRVKSLTLPFHFNANQTTPINFPDMPYMEEKILGVTIKSYSSIEGNEEGNMRLHNKRAKVIKDYLSKFIDANPDAFTIETKENWVEFYFQLKLSFADSLLTRSKDELRAMASSRSVPQLPWDSLLYNQRKSIATIYFEPQNNADADPNDIYFNNLKYAIITENIPLAKKALYEIYHNEAYDPSQLFEESIFDFITNDINLVQNTAAVFGNYHKTNLEQSIRFINKWLVSSSELNDDAIFNLLNLYTIINNKLLTKWDLPSQRLANVVNPKYILQFYDDNFSSELMLNLQLTFIKYFGQINDGPNLHKSFNFISNYFERRALDIEDAIALCKFYNNWSMYHLTNKYLYARFERGKLNEDATFLLLKTLNYYKEEKDDFDLEGVFNKGIELNKNRWCTWVDHNFQLVRDRSVKKLYCERCN